MAIKKGGLGKGLEALFEENSSYSSGVTELKLTEIEPNRLQPRKDFDEKSLEELCESIKTNGLLQPIVVRPLQSGGYGIIAGERRWRACRMAGLVTVPVVIKDLDEQSAAEASLVENLQREDLNPYEEAAGYKALIDRFGLTQDKVAERVSKSRTAVTNALRLLKLPDEMLNALREGKISASQARTLLAAEGEKQREMFKAALFGAGVRELEKMLKKPDTQKAKPKIKNNYHTEVALALKQGLNRPVSIKTSGKGKGSITLEFYSDDELKDFAERLLK